MIFGNGSKESSSIAQRAYFWFRAIWQRLSVRFVLLLGLLVFLTAVGVDSLQEASAADLSTEYLGWGTAPASAVSESNSLKAKSLRRLSQKSYLEFDAAIADRLGHSDLTCASITRNRLTRAHLFTPRT